MRNVKKAQNAKSICKKRLPRRITKQRRILKGLSPPIDDLTDGRITGALCVMQKRCFLEETNIKRSLLLMIAWTEGITDLHRRVMRKIVTNVKEYQFQN